MGTKKSYQHSLRNHPRSALLWILLSGLFKEVTHTVIIPIRKSGKHPASPTRLLQSILSQSADGVKKVPNFTWFRNLIHLKDFVRKSRARVFFFVLLFSLLVLILSGYSLFKQSQYLKHSFEKPCRLLFHQYQVASLFLHFKQWVICNQHDSLELVLYAAMPRNPE